MLKTSTSLALSIALLLGTTGALAASSDGPDGANSLPQYTDAVEPGTELASVLAPEETTHYLFITGSALTPYNSTGTVSYHTGGCASSSTWLTTDLQLPHGSTLLGVRTYYYDNAAAGVARTGVSKYDGLGTSTTVSLNDMPHSTGYNNVYYSPASTEVIDNFSNSYVLYANTGTDTRICGFRVFYSIP